MPMSELHEECGIAAIYHLPSDSPSPLCPEEGAEHVSRLCRACCWTSRTADSWPPVSPPTIPRRDQLIDTTRMSDR
jgi:amidophosphoribosyltransferase